MLACVDVDYRGDRVVSACVEFAQWTDAVSSNELVIVREGIAAEYAPGEFYRRELPYVLDVLQPLGTRLELAIVDGYVWLGPGRRGLGAYVHDALAIPVIGIAKSPFAGAEAIEVMRGTSTRPLYVTANGIDSQVAAEHVRMMHGEFRLPTLLTRVDQLARGLVNPSHR